MVTRVSAPEGHRRRNLQSRRIYIKTKVSLVDFHTTGNGSDYLSKKKFDAAKCNLYSHCIINIGLFSSFRQNNRLPINELRSYKYFVHIINLKGDPATI